MLERTTIPTVDFEAALSNYMEKQQWSEVERQRMHHYIGHHVVSSEAALNILLAAEAVKDRQELES